jgi:acetoin utilization protein AcuC
MPKTAFLYTEEFLRFDYGPTHPLRISRLNLAYELIKAYGLLSLPDTWEVEVTRATEQDLLTFHSREYIDILKAANNGIRLPYGPFFGVGSDDNPAFKGLLDWSELVTGGSLQAAALVECGEVDIAFNIAGGLHHAQASRASGFCYINDIVIAISSLLKKGKRIAYIDIDAHHGDGVQDAFYGTDQVLTISIHETGEVLFPGTGFEYETGSGQGQGYTVNIPMPPYADDEIFLYAFNETVPPLIDKFSPDIVVTQLGVDSFHADPLAHLNYTNRGFCEAVKKLKEMAPKWVALGGGGYDVVNVAKAWTLAWAIMNEIQLPDQIPEEFIKRHAGAGFEGGSIRDDGYIEGGPGKDQMRDELERVVTFIQDKVIAKMKPL